MDCIVHIGFDRLDFRCVHSMLAFLSRRSFISAKVILSPILDEKMLYEWRLYYFAKISPFFFLAERFWPWRRSSSPVCWRRVQAWWNFTSQSLRPLWRGLWYCKISSPVLSYQTWIFVMAPTTSILSVNILISTEVRFSFPSQQRFYDLCSLLNEDNLLRKRREKGSTNNARERLLLSRTGLLVEIKFIPPRIEGKKSLYWKQNRGLHLSVSILRFWLISTVDFQCKAKNLQKALDPEVHHDFL